MEVTHGLERSHGSDHTILQTRIPYLPASIRGNPLTIIRFRLAMSCTWEASLVKFIAGINTEVPTSSLSHSITTGTPSGVTVSLCSLVDRYVGRSGAKSKFLFFIHELRAV
jgi:hypothetical protein